MKSACLTLISLLALAAPGLAETNVTLDAATTSTVARTLATFDQYHAFISKEVTYRASVLDSWLGGETDLDDIQQEPQDTTLKLRVSFKFSRDKGISASPALSGKLSLPHFQNRFHIFIDNLKRGVLPGESEDRSSSDELKAGVRVDFVRRARAGLSLDGGVDLNPWPAPFSSLTGAWRIPVRSWTTTLSQQGYWKSGDGFGETSEMDWDRPVKTNVAFRSITAANWSETTDGIEFEQTVRFTWKQIPNRKEWEFSGSVFANKQSPFYMNNYRVMVNFWTQIWRPWFYIDVQPQIEFPRDDDYEFTPSLRIGFNVYFGANSG